MRPASLEELDIVRDRCRGLVNRRSAVAAAKAATIGSENLSHLVATIADAFGLSEAEVALMAPEASLGLEAFATTHVTAHIKNTAYMGKLMKAAGKVGNARTLRGMVSAVKKGVRFTGPTARSVGRSAAGKAAKKVATVATGKAARVGAKKVAQAGARELVLRRRW